MNELLKLSIPKLVLKAQSMDSGLGNLAAAVAKQKKKHTKLKLVEMIEEWGVEPPTEDAEAEASDAAIGEASKNILKPASEVVDAVDEMIASATEAANTDTESEDNLVDEALIDVLGLHKGGQSMGNSPMTWLDNSYVDADGDQLTVVAIPTIVKFCNYDGAKWAWVKFGRFVTVKVTEGSDLASHMGMTWGTSGNKNARIPRGKVFVVTGIWFELPDETISLKFQVHVEDNELTFSLKKARKDVYANWYLSKTGVHPGFNNPYA